jgi:potassium channel subfamily K, other eukaryote
VWLRQKSSVRQGWRAWFWSWVAADVHPGGFSYGPHNRRLNLEALSADQLEKAALATGVPLQMLLPSDFVLGRNGPTPFGHVSGTHTHHRMARMAGLLTRFAFAHGAGVSQLDIQSQDQSTLARDNSTVTEKGKSIQDEGVSIREKEQAGSQAESDDVPDRRVLDEKAFDAFLNGVEELERKAFYTKLFVAWTLFALFWFVSCSSILEMLYVY